MKHRLGTARYDCEQCGQTFGYASPERDGECPGKVEPSAGREAFLAEWKTSIYDKIAALESENAALKRVATTAAGRPRTMAEAVMPRCPECGSVHYSDAKLRLRNLGVEITQEALEDDPVLTPKTTRVRWDGSDLQPVGLSPEELITATQTRVEYIAAMRALGHDPDVDLVCLRCWRRLEVGAVETERCPNAHFGGETVRIMGGYPLTGEGGEFPAPWRVVETGGVRAVVAANNRTVVSAGNAPCGPEE